MPPGLDDLRHRGAHECTQSVYVWKVGDDYLIGFRGEVNEDRDHPVPVGLSALGTATAAVADAPASTASATPASRR